MRFEPQKSVVAGKPMPADGICVVALMGEDFGTSRRQLFN
jgi:hypothetical protein